MTDETPKTIMCFSAELQKETPHTIDIDGNGEIVLTCTETGRFLKFPKGTIASDLKSLMASHKDANLGQLSVEQLEAQKKALLDELTKPEEEKPVA